MPFRQSEPEHWDELHEINLRQLFVVTRVFLPMLFTDRNSSIINVHSVEALRGYPPDPVYAAYKAAAAHFTTSLAGELGRKGIRVNGIAPDITQTPQVDYRATTEPEAGPVVGGVGADRSRRPAGGPGRRGGVPRVGPLALRHRPEPAGRRRHARLRRMVLVAVAATFHQPAAEPLS